MTTAMSARIAKCPSGDSNDHDWKLLNLNISFFILSSFLGTWAPIQLKSLAYNSLISTLFSVMERTPGKVYNLYPSFPSNATKYNQRSSVEHQREYSQSSMTSHRWYKLREVTLPLNIFIYKVKEIWLGFIKVPCSTNILWSIPISI